MKRVCRRGGVAFVTVPAFMSLWSDHDLINHHFRRYVSTELKALFKSGGEIRYQSYFNAILFPPIYVARKLSNLLSKKGGHAPKSDFNKFKPGILNRILYGIFITEKFFLNRKWQFPAGVSIMLIWKKSEK